MAAERVVLIVDDDPTVLETMRILLEGRGGYRVHVALGSHGATHCMATIGPVDVLIADVVLAGDMTGIHVCEQAIGRNPGIALVVISADSRSDAALMPSYSIYLRKPFGGVDLVEAIEEAARLGPLRLAASEA